MRVTREEVITQGSVSFSAVIALFIAIGLCALDIKISHTNPELWKIGVVFILNYTLAIFLESGTVLLYLMIKKEMVPDISESDFRKYVGQRKFHFLKPFS